MSGHPALFLDRDGTIIQDHHHTHRADQVFLFPGVKPALVSCLESGYRLFILTNQSGINRQIFTWDQYHEVNARMFELLELPAPGILEIKAAPERPDEPSEYRKPSPKFILEKIDQHELDPTRCWMVGDRTTDWYAGLNAGIKACAVRSGAPWKVEDEITARERGVIFHTDLTQFIQAELKLGK
jgi:D-glycero-D-manno-heptose 1,7-bisphosphate phosphatase